MAAGSEAVAVLADRLYRTAEETLRQRERYARLVAAGAPEAEQQAALRVVCLCDELLFAAAREYHAAAGQVQEMADWWHRANALWLASREYERRHRNCDDSLRGLYSKRPEKLGQLAMEYDLEASALLALKLALEEYHRSRPGCVLGDPGRSNGA